MSAEHWRVLQHLNSMALVVRMASSFLISYTRQFTPTSSSTCLRLNKNDDLPDLFRLCGAELRELELYGTWTVLTKSDIYAIGTYCPRLSSLKIDSCVVEGTLMPIWRSLGSALTQINIDYYFPASGGDASLDIISAPDLAEHCVSLQRVSMVTLNDEMADVLVALGDRIRVLYIVDEFIESITPWRKCTEHARTSRQFI